MLLFDDHKLGETEGNINVDTNEQHQQAIISMTRQATRTIDIISRELDPRIYNTTEFVEATKQVALRSRHSLIRIILFEPQLVRKRGHRLLDLAENLTTFIKFRVPGNEHKDFNEALFVADGIGFTMQLIADRYEGKVNFADRRQSRILLNEFDEIWAKAKPDPNLRRVNL